MFGLDTHAIMDLLERQAEAMERMAEAMESTAKTAEAILDHLEGRR